MISRIEAGEAHPGGLRDLSTPTESQVTNIYGLHDVEYTLGRLL